MIDALDEAGEAGHNPLVEMLARNAQRLPDWLGLVVTSRPEFDVKTPLQALNPFPLDTASESNRADIRDYLLRELAPSLQNRPDADLVVEQILEKSEGVFLYAERFCDDVQQGHLSLYHPDQFPQGLGGIFAQYFQRQFPDLKKFRKDVRPALRAILAAREPLPIEILQRLFNWQDEELRDFTRPIASLFPVTPQAGNEVIKPYHKSLADWLTNGARAGVYYVSLADGHRTIAGHMLSSYIEGNASDFTIKHLFFHLNQSGRLEDLKPHLTHEEYTELQQLALWKNAARCEVYLSFSQEDESLGRWLCDRLSENGFRAYHGALAIPDLGNYDLGVFVDESIDAAKCMIVVATAQSHINRDRVNYEWRCFHYNIITGRKTGDTRIFSFVTGMDPLDLPLPLRMQISVTFEAGNPMSALQTALKIIT